MDITELIKGGHIQKIGPSSDLAEKEFAEAKYDLEHSHSALDGKDHKWAIVKAYYAVFHSAKGILFLMGYREKSHFAVGEMLDLISKEGKLEGRYIADFKAAMSARQGADYHYDHSPTLACEIVGLADEFVDRMMKLRKEF